MSTARRVVPAVALSAGLALTLPGIATAADPGWRNDPVQFWAVGNDQCEVEFTVVNKTNAFYVVDYIVDDEDPVALTGKAGWSLTGTTVNATLDGVATTRVVGRRGVSTAPEAPVFASPGVPYDVTRNPVTTTNTIDLRTLPELPNAGADTHTVTYQVILGPNGRDKGWDPVAKQFARFTTDVSGCLTQTATTLAGPTQADKDTPVTYTATVTPPEATGSVQFQADGQPIGTAVAVVNGTATLTHTFTTVGTVNLTADFTGDLGFANSPSNTLAVQVTEPGGGGSAGSSGSADLSLSSLFGS